VRGSEARKKLLTFGPRLCGIGIVAVDEYRRNKFGATGRY
jgi:hypothetical protein